MPADPPIAARRSLVFRPVLCALLAALIAGGAALPATGGSELSAQVVEADQGVVATGLGMRQLQGFKRVLLIAAHPDDENTSLITALARTWGAEVAYLSLSRGEGGQNLIGPELDEGLGIVRTGELLAARELDGGDQFFSRAFDFGYSKTSRESFELWPRDEILADVVWVVRKFRPQVLVSVFPPDERAGHGQHQVAGILAHEAFGVAGDATRFPEQLTGPDAVEPWAPDKLYRGARFNPGDASVTIETGAMDPLLGRSAHQLAMESRSQHRSQDMGTEQDPGPRRTYLQLIESRVNDVMMDRGVFDGVDTLMVSVADGLEPRDRSVVASRISAYTRAIRGANQAGSAFDVRALVPHLGRASVALEDAVTAALSLDGGESAARELRKRLEKVREAVLSAAGVEVEVRTDDDLVVPGQEVEVAVTVWNGGPYPITDAEPTLELPDGWTAVPVEPGDPDPERGAFPGRDFAGDDGVSTHAGPAAVEPGALARWTYRVRIPEDADVSRLYYMDEERDGEIYRWPDDRSLWGLPRNPPVLNARVALEIQPDDRATVPSRAGDGPGVDAIPVEVRRSAEYVDADQASGEFRRPLLVVPRLSVASRPGIMAWPLAETGARPVTVTVRNEAEDGFSGRLSLDAPAGWSVSPEAVALELGASGEKRSITFQVRPAGGEGIGPGGGAGGDRDSAPGTHVLRAVAVADDGARFAEGFRIVDYPHIDRNLLFDDAETRISLFPVEVDDDLRVGYIMGTGDGGAEALQQIGVDVTLLGPDAVRDGAFQDLDVIVLGIRAYETRDDLIGANQQLLDWVRDGGRLILQYNQYTFSGGGFAPYPVSISRPHDRVTDETAPVTLLDPESPVFTLPNVLDDGDFDGWAQERGLYFLGEWDDRYTPLLEMADPGEEPTRGSLVVTPLGEGLWIYTGVAFFRQFPEGVPGGYRFLANLISLEPEEWAAHHGNGSAGAAGGPGAAGTGGE